MNKETLREKLQDKFNREDWKQILEACFPEREFNYSPHEIMFERIGKREEVEKIYNLGEVELDEIKLKFLEVELKENATQLPRNRVGLRKIVDSNIRRDVEGAAIIVYRQPDYEKWRISFYSEQYRWDEVEGIVKDETNPNRYTFLVGGDETCVTPSRRLYTLINKTESITLEDVMKAFSVEKVSKRFFDEYKHQYDKFVSYLTGKVWSKDGEQEVGEPINQFDFFFQATSDHEKEARDFVKKLLGCIVFLYFVQKKGWLGAEKEDFSKGSITFIRDLFEQVQAKGNPDHFYSIWLRKLFFEGLNEKENLTFEMPDESICYMPFLNGGLFEQDKTDNNTEGLPLPGWLFHNPDHADDPEDKYNRPNKRGFLDFLDSFNFTIHEDSPGDHTIAVDPEMLGHIFENLLEDNKEKGAYYTPKPVVHYMCQESIIEFLNTELNGDETLRSDIEALIKDQETGRVDHFYEGILTALKEVKVCDPAIGSGAFPMGILQEIYQAVKNIYYASPDSVRATWELKNGNWNPAAIKKQIIQHSIYGVDIEQGAVDIARLRFWLSLIVDEQDPTPLPNLEYKIITGDSLLSQISLEGEDEIIEIDWKIEEKNGKLWAQDELERQKDLLNQIFTKQKQFFHSEKIDKTDLSLEIRNLKIDLLINQLDLMIKVKGVNEEPRGKGNKIRERQELFLKTKKWKKTKAELLRIKDNPSEEFEHFDWELDFPEILNPVVAGDDPGFDIIIANPPYGITVTGDYREIVTKTLGKVPDYEIYYLFIELLENLMSSTTISSYIIPNSILFNVYAANFRGSLLDRFEIKEVLDLTDVEIFDATVRNIVLFLKEGSNEKIGFRKPNEIQSFEEIISREKEYILNQKLDKFEQNWALAFRLPDDIVDIITKVKSDKELAKSRFNDISQGLIPYDKRKGQTQEVIDNRVYHYMSKEKQDLKPWLWGEDVTRYHLEWNGKEYIDYCDGIANPRKPKYFKGDRILVREMRV